MKFHNIEANNIENGEGIRTLLWVSGCYHNCYNCHNPITHDKDDGLEFTEESMDELFDYISQDHVNGLTLTGGDGLCYYTHELCDLILRFRKKFGRSKTIWLYTGFTLDELLERINSHKDSTNSMCLRWILSNIDILCDGKYVEELALKEYHWVGSTNQRVIDMRKTLERGIVVFYEKDQEELYTPDKSYNLESLEKSIQSFYVENKDKILG